MAQRKSVTPLVGVVMGSESDWDTLRHAAAQLDAFGVPVPSRHLAGQDSLYSIVQMPKGIPVGTFAIGEAGAANAGLFAVAMLALNDKALAKKLQEFRAKQADAVRAVKLPDLP